MPYPHLISAAELVALQNAGAPLMMFDCSFDLMQPERGAAAFAAVHIKDAVYADLNQNLSSHAGAASASGGRHPLPSRENFADWLSSVGLENAMQVVVYDRNQCNYCVRLWWMLKWLGHENVAVLDGGLPAYQALGAPLAGSNCSHLSEINSPKLGSENTPTHSPASSNTRPTVPATERFTLQEPLVQLVQAEQLLAHLHDGSQTIIDARAKPRYLGEVEPIDPVAGHIPGALNRPFSENFDAQGFFKPATQLREEFALLVAGKADTQIIHQCGSGVSATPNVLAMMLAGYSTPALYAGSWSDWISDSSRPIHNPSADKPHAANPSR